MNKRLTAVATAALMCTSVATAATASAGWIPAPNTTFTYYPALSSAGSGWMPAPTETFTYYKPARHVRKYNKRQVHAYNRYVRKQLHRLLPYYGKKVPAGCMEDEFCWIGSINDNRTDAQLAKLLGDLTVNCFADDPRLDDATAEGCDGTSPLAW